MTHDIDIDDLAAPKLSEAQRQSLAWGESVPTELTVEAVLEAAQRRTGLSDFGPQDFLTRLRILAEGWDADRQITALARRTLQGYLVRYASNRLLIHEFLKQHPQVEEEPIVRPVIVAGLPRSGTTHLVNLLAADERLHSLPLWESYEPVPLPNEPQGPDGTDPRFARCAEAWAGMQHTTPLIAAMHPMAPEHIHEELELMGPDFASYNFEWLAHSPFWRDHYYATDQTPHYEYMKQVLRLLQWRRRQEGCVRERWVLKCPQHIEQLPVLNRVFPDATVVFTHRDPVEVIQSTLTMQAYTQRINRRHPALDSLAEYWVERVHHLLRACVRDRALVPGARSYDLPFQAFMADPMGRMEEVYAVAGLPLDARARGRLRDYLGANPRGKDGRVVYHLKRDFGIDPDALRKEFRYYIDRFALHGGG